MELLVLAGEAGAHPANLSQAFACIALRLFVASLLGLLAGFVVDLHVRFQLEEQIGAIHHQQDHAGT